MFHVVDHGVCFNSSLKLVQGSIDSCSSDTEIFEFWTAVASRQFLDIGVIERQLLSGSELLLETRFLLGGSALVLHGANVSFQLLLSGGCARFLISSPL